MCLKIFANENLKTISQTAFRNRTETKRIREIKISFSSDYQRRFSCPFLIFSNVEPQPTTLEIYKHKILKCTATKLRVFLYIHLTTPKKILFLFSLKCSKDLEFKMNISFSSIHVFFIAFIIILSFSHKVNLKRLEIKTLKCILKARRKQLENWQEMNQQF